MLNLITSDWLPVLRATGRREVIAPHQLTDGLTGSDPIVSLDFGRPDLDGAVTELLIGLVAVAMGPKDNKAWAEVWQAPPSPGVLRDAFAPLTFAFNLGGDGPRCFQDMDALIDGKQKQIRNLFVDYPGENAFQRNTDHFIKFDDTPLTAELTAAALVLRQFYTPGEGGPHRSSVRGEGPLTTLARWTRESENGRSSTTLWDTIWLNVPEVREAPNLDEKLFPWIGATLTSENEKIVTPDPAVAHSLQALFGMPRRIRLEFNENGIPATYRMQKNGPKYPAEAWRHPLSPYYKDTEGKIRPLHLRPGPASYRDWLGVLVNREGAFRATCVNAAEDRLGRIGVKRANRGADIIAFGYIQESAKTVSFVVQSVPWVFVAQEKTFSDLMTVAVVAAEATARAVRYAVQMARHGKVSVSDKGEASISLRDEGKKSAQDVYHAFYALSEPKFRAYLDAVAKAENFEDARETRAAFAQDCRLVARQLFAAHADKEGRDLRRNVLAEKWLGIALNASKAKSYVFKSLQLDIKEAAHG